MILESPVHPVPEGTSVTLRCLKSSSQLDVVTPINQSCTFSRDGQLVGVCLTGEMSFPAVNRSYEGLYRCNFSGEVSPGSWLAVRGELCVWSPHGEVLQSHYRGTMVELLYH